MIPSLPYEVQLHIAVCTACIDPLGPPIHLPALLATCSTIYRTLTGDSELFARIFRAKFDCSAPRRRFGVLLNRALADQLKTYCTTLKRIRAGDLHAPTLEFDLWQAFLMLLESDGKNFVQLVEYARLPSFADRLIRIRLSEGRAPGEWPIEDNVNSLTAWLCWMTTSNSMLRAESDTDRAALIRLLLPYTLCCFRYNCFYAADIHYSLPLSRTELPTPPTSVQTAHGPYPQYPPDGAFTDLTHYDQPIRVARPILVPAVQLLYFARRELNGFHIPPNIPVDREHALSLGQATGATQADYHELNAHPSARLLDQGKWDWREDLLPQELAKISEGNERFPFIRALSSRWDADWERLLGCYSPYSNPTSGAFSRYAWTSLIGQWVGRMLISAENSYMAMIENPALPHNFSETFPWTSTRPFLLTLKEYHCISPEEPVDFRGVTVDNDTDQGVLNAYLPHIDMLEEKEFATFIDIDHSPVKGERLRHRYDRVDPEKPSSHSEETCAYCQGEAGRYPTNMRRQFEELEPLFEEAGVGRAQNVAVDSDDSSGLDTYDHANAESGPCHGVQDIIFTGITEERHGNAWCHYMYYGRLREWDGLIVLVGVPLWHCHACQRAVLQNDVNERLWGRWIFRGYIHGGQNFTGRWRHFAYDVFAPAWEGAFTLSKREDTG